jgi:hypothetical protein
LLVLAIGVLVAVALATVTLAAAAPVRVTPFGSEGTGSGQLRRPGGLAIDAAGNVFVADTDNNRVDEFSSAGAFLRAWGWGVADGTSALQTCTSSCLAGQAGQGTGQLSEPVAVAVSPGGDVYALNRATGDGRIERFSVPATSSAPVAFVEAFGGYGAAPEKFAATLAFGSDIAVDSSGKVYVADAGRARVAIFGPAGEFLSENTGEGKLAGINSIALDAAGNLYVSRTSGISTGAIALVEPSGHVVRTQGEPFQPYTGLAIDPADGHLFAERATFEPPAYALVEFDPNGKELAATPLSEMTPQASGQPASYGLAFGPAATFSEFEPGAFYLADRAGSLVNALAEQAPGVPRIAAVSAIVSTSFADLSATVDPHGSDTQAIFEYGTTTSYGSTFPAAPGQDIGAGFDAVPIGAHLTGLAPNTTYHYRLVASNAEGVVETPDATFRTFPTGAGTQPLPDGRAYELVTSQDKGNNDAESIATATVKGVAGGDEEGVAFATVNGLPGSENGALVTNTVAHRTADGWVLGFPVVATFNQSSIATGKAVLLSQDLNQALVPSTLNLTGDAPERENLFVRTLSPSSLKLITPLDLGPVRTAYEPQINSVGAASDFSRVFFAASAKLTEDSPDLGFTNGNLYEWDGSTLRNVGILPGTSTPASAGVTTFRPSLQPVSEDGERVVFAARPVGLGVPQIFVREDGVKTIEASAPTVVDPEGRKTATFVGAAADGSSVFFTSPGKLTPDAFTGKNASGKSDLAPNLYRYDLEGGELEDLTIAESEERGANVTATHIVVAPSGNSAYFVAGGVLAPGATSGARNLYRWSRGGGTEFIAKLLATDPFFTSSGPEAVSDQAGDALAFVSAAGLTGESPVGIKEVYRFAPGAGLTCVSCRPGSARAGAEMKPPTIPGGAGGHPISADGSRVFFSTADRLVTEDTNGKIDTYEWEGGQVHLISSGTGSSDSRFLDASPSGRDVFFVTREQLVAADRDENTDIYDAREGGGFPAALALGAPCEAEACRPPLEAAPSTPQLNSRSFNGPGNGKPRKQAKKHHRKHHRKKCKPKTKKCSRKPRQGRSAGKRG